MAGEDLYQMLGLDKSASQADIKKAYYKLALQWHPDRNPAPEATAKFQALQRIYDVLSDPAKRQMYDRTGSLQDCEDMMQGDNFQELYTAFREALKVTEDDIDSFAFTYRGSAEERADLLSLYQQLSGNMARVFDWLMLSRPDLDSHRFRDTIEGAIEAGEVKRLKAYKAWAAQVAATPPPTIDPLAPPKKRKGKGGKQGTQGGSDQLALVAAIKGKQTAFNGMLAALEAKYAGNGTSKAKKQQAGAAAAGASDGKRKRGSKAGAAAAAEVSSSDSEADDSEGGVGQGQEPTDEEFEAARARLVQKATKTTSNKVKPSKAAHKQPAAAGPRAGKGRAKAAASASGSTDKAAAGAAVKSRKRQKA